MDFIAAYDIGINKPEVTEDVLKVWQEMVNSLSVMAEVPASLVMHVLPEKIEVARTSNAQNNPYGLGASENLGCGLYCETVMRKKQYLHVPNSLEDEAWKNNPDIPLGMISYYGLPLLWPDKTVYGTICILDSKDLYPPQHIKQLMGIYRQAIENDLKILEQAKELIEANKRNANSKLRISAKVLEKTSDGVVVTDKEQKIIFINSGFTKTTGYSESEVIGKNPKILNSGKHDEKFFASMWDSLNSTGQWQGEIWNKHKSGRIYPELLNICQIINEDGNLEYYAGIFSDLTTQEETKQRLYELAYYDDLTSLPNRSLLNKDMKIQPEAYVAILNIRGFTHINDVFGFDAGNFILRELSNRFSEKLMGNGFSIYRVGSDEVVILNNILTSKDKFREFIAAVIKQMDNEIFHYPKDEVDISVTIYAGICFDKERRLEKADMALHQAQIEHKDYVVYSKDEDTKNIQEKNIEIINKIKNAIQNDDVIAYYQPIVDLNASIIKYEALVRLRDGDDILTPYFFLDIAKKTKYYHQITHRVITKTFELFRDREESFSINLTAEDILNTEVVSFIKSELLNFSNIERVIFEIVESEDIYNIIEIEEFIIEMKKMGVKIAIDDFGTGYSNFSYMMKLEPDYIKIDGSMIKNIDKDDNARRIVKTIVTFAKELSINTIAEFVHSKEVFDICKELGVNEFQGYYFSEPLEKLD
ncbi:diguanylate cyclase/phosphodiesterase (GGDEF & EAL domains) with PAS/PAC sensor(s) [Sulfurimonas gotlandica GD1]|uniref:Diguanylate cyclase/phosphodiesterase (GGDEF & EAL domains) with PAS/PAC sensor(S) n=2 Tax=Sulfurimonas TaxID=202746 RepID=B6BNY7_SULGG|nr:diguanylate cyclase/phosphodiesterase [Sulfurimonas gotlandica GD1]EHP28943.1 diguanylate cyclase/phosphodiesterase (GGDEF & EAL domains) with PAS/PAC sensor(s) [Sulfurimonas gotlandica GD1]